MGAWGGPAGTLKMTGTTYVCVCLSVPECVRTTQTFGDSKSIGITSNEDLENEPIKYASSSLKAITIRLTNQYILGDKKIKPLPYQRHTL